LKKRTKKIVLSLAALKKNKEGYDCVSSLGAAGLNIIFLLLFFKREVLSSFFRGRGRD
jgi:hypothetical protein